MRKPKIGSKIKTWFSDSPTGFSTVLKVRKYEGIYSQWFKWIVTVAAPRTLRREIETAI